MVWLRRCLVLASVIAACSPFSSSNSDNTPPGPPLPPQQDGGQPNQVDGGTGLVPTDSGLPDGLTTGCPPNATFCERFDQGVPQDDHYGSATVLGASTTEFVSPPASLHVVARDNEAGFQKTVTATSSLTVDLDAKFASLASGGGKVGPLFLVFDNAQDVQLFADRNSCYWQRGSTNPDPLPPCQTDLTQWTHVKISVAWTGGANQAVVSASIGQALYWNQQTFTLNSGQIKVRFGAASIYEENSDVEVFIDNVVIVAK